MPIRIGDSVQVIDSSAKLKVLQDEGHGGWREEMREVLFSLLVL